MRRLFFAILTSLIFVACGGDSSISANDATSSDSAGSSGATAESSSSGAMMSSSGAEESSSSVESSGSVESSSSAAVASSGSVAKSSSSVAKSSSSVAESSSSVAKSSSSVAASSSSKANWAYLNPAISYGEFTDSRDKQVYKTVKIGTQTWMAENLNYAVDSSWCYNNSADSCAKYGRLYKWTGAMNIASTYQSKLASEEIKDQHQGVCPSGWHVPTAAEWDALATAVGGSNSAGAKLKSTNGWYSDGNGTDDYGFSALPAGSRFNGGGFYNVRHCAYFWSATEYNESLASRRYLRYGGAGMYTYRNDYKDDAFSVRCVQDF